MNNYTIKKEEARQTAIKFQMDNHEKASFSWGEYLEITNKLEKLAKRYGLVRELKENGII